jgi:hypothetical protein
MGLIRRKPPSTAQRAASAARGTARMVATAGVVRAVVAGAVALAGLTTASAAVSSARERQGAEGAHTG